MKAEQFGSTVAAQLFAWDETNERDPFSKQEHSPYEGSEAQKEAKNKGLVDEEGGHGLKFAPQPVSFDSLQALQHPIHSACIHIKSMMTVGMGLVQAGTDTDYELPTASPMESFQDVLNLCGLEAENVGNAYMGVDEREQVYWLPARTIEAPAGNHKLYRQTVGPHTRHFSHYGDTTTEGADGRLIHFRFPHFWSTIYGGPDWLGALRPLLLADSILRFNQAFFDNRCMPVGILQLTGFDPRQKDKRGDETEAKNKMERLQEWFERLFGRVENAFKVLITASADPTSQINYQKLMDRQSDGDFLKLMDSCDNQIASAHRTPRALLSMATPGKLGGNSDQYGQLYIALTTHIMQKQRAITSTLNRTICKENPCELRSYDLGPLMQTTTTPDPLDPQETLEQGVERVLRSVEKLRTRHAAS